MIISAGNKIALGICLGAFKRPWLYDRAVGLGLANDLKTVLDQPRFASLTEAKKTILDLQDQGQPVVPPDHCLVVSVRHPATDYSLIGRTAGIIDVPINELGQRQMESLEPVLRGLHFNSIFSSPLQRCSVLARFLATSYDRPAIFHDALRELNYGSWAGRILSRAKGGQASIEFQDPRGYYKFFNRPHLWQANCSETFAEMAERIEADLKGIVQLNLGGVVLVVSHGWALSTAFTGAFGIHLAYCLKVPLGQPTSVNIIEYSADLKNNRLWLWGNADHLAASANK